MVLTEPTSTRVPKRTNTPPPPSNSQSEQGLLQGTAQSLGSSNT